MIAEIRERFAAGESAATLAREFGYCQDNIYRICRGETHKGDPGPLTRGLRKRKITRQDKRVIQMLRHGRGRPLSELAEQYGISVSYASLICAGKR